MILTGNQNGAIADFPVTVTLNVDGGTITTQTDDITETASYELWSVKKKGVDCFG